MIINPFLFLMLIILSHIITLHVLVTATSIVPLERLQIVGVRYSNANYNGCSGCALDDYLENGVYDAASVPWDYVEAHLDDDLRTGDQAADVGVLCADIADHVAAARRKGFGTVMTGGNCVHLVGVLSGLQQAHSFGRIGIAFIDAHGDLNTANTTLSGSLGGQPIAVAMGWTWPQWRNNAGLESPLPAERVAIFDARDLDPMEHVLIDAMNITIGQFPGCPAPPKVISFDTETAIAELARYSDIIYLHIDADAFDEKLMPDHRLGSPGPNLDQMEATTNAILETGKVASVAIVSVQQRTKNSNTVINIATATSALTRILSKWRTVGLPPPPSKQ